jgi:biotin-(acetyl-CoA carboxylase) ligase
VNVNTRTFPADLRKIATSLIQLQGKPASRPALAAEILNCMEEEYAEWQRNGLTNILQFLNKHSCLAGREVTATLSHETIRGRAEKITENGSLRVVLSNGTKVEISTGEVKLCRA